MTGLGNLQTCPAQDGMSASPLKDGVIGRPSLWIAEDIHTQFESKTMARKGKLVEAVAYIRTSSAANVGPDKDSDKRQRAAIESFAKRTGFALVAEFTDAAVSGADPIESRAGFAVYFPLGI
jgi:hypothetical protein